MKWRPTPTNAVWIFATRSGNIGFSENFARKRRRLGFVPQALLSAGARLLPGGETLLGRLRYLLSTDVETAVRRRQRLLHRPGLRNQHPQWLAERDPVPAVLSRVPRGAQERTRIQVVDFYQGTVSHMVTLSSIATPAGVTLGYPFLWTSRWRFPVGIRGSTANQSQ